MHSTKFWIIPLLVLFQLFGNSLPIGIFGRRPPLLGLRTIFSGRQGGTHVIDTTKECMLVWHHEGEFSYAAASDDNTVCGVYMVAEPSKMVELKITSMDVPCDGGAMVKWIDGWEQNGRYFPVATDHPKSMDERVVEKCGAEPVEEVFVSNQNVAVFQYRVPAQGKGFTIKVRHIDNPTPCNILLTDPKDDLTLSNHGKVTTCSVSAIFPASITVKALTVGIGDGTSGGTIETGCDGKKDYAVIGGSSGVDLTEMEKAETVCGRDPAPANVLKTIACGVSTVRLFSSGDFDNTVTLDVKKLEDSERPNASVECAI